MNVLITGASRGLGLIAADAFEKDGWEVFRFDSKRLDFLNMPAYWQHGIPEDLDAIIHCAGGGLGLRGPYLPAQDFYKLFMTNLGGAAEVNRIFAPVMQARRTGYIVHVCSIASGEAIGSVGYNTVKAALSAYVRSLGRTLAPYGVVVTGIAPGGFRAPGNAMERLEVNNPEAYEDFVSKRLPRGKMGEADEIVPLLKFLCSPAASMMAGSVVAIDAGEGHYYSSV